MNPEKHPQPPLTAHLLWKGHPAPLPSRTVPQFTDKHHALTIFQLHNALNGKTVIPKHSHNSVCKKKVFCNKCTLTSNEVGLYFRYVHERTIRKSDYFLCKVSTLRPLKPCEGWRRCSLLPKSRGELSLYSLTLLTAEFSSAKSEHWKPLNTLNQSYFHRVSWRNILFSLEIRHLFILVSDQINF